MWEVIARNRRRSLVLISLLGVVLVLLGLVIGAAIDPQRGALFGAAAATLLWLILWITAASSGDNILTAAAGAHELSKQDAPQLWNVVEEMTIAAGLGKMPRVFLIDDPAPNAFAVGQNPEQAAIVVTAGLLKRLNRDELQGVIGHEMGHIWNRDVRFLTQAAVMIGAIALLSDLFLRGFLRGGGGRRSSSRDAGGAQALFVVLAIVLAILAPLAAQLLYFACSRQREYLADASAARFTRYPEGLASALEKIRSQSGFAERVQRVVAPLYIINPLQEQAAFSLFSTHPPTADRVRILRGMAGAGLAAYEAAYQQVHGGSRHCIGARSLQSADTAPIRPASEAAESADPVTRAQAVGQILDRVTNFVVIPCACGTRLKVPPNYEAATIQCPGCGRVHDIPVAVPVAPAADRTAESFNAPEISYQRTGAGWESFRCRCGGTVQLSPSFSGDRIACPRCGTSIAVKGQ